MRRTIAHAISSGVLLLLAGTACTSGNTVTTKPNDSKPSATGSSRAAQSTAGRPKTAAVGDTITLKGTSKGAQLDVTVKRWLDPAVSANGFLAPKDGNRWVAAQFELVNTGSAAYEDSPSNGSQVADTSGQRFHTTFGEITAGPLMPAAAKVAPGDKALGWILFEVPKTSKIATVQFTMDSGFADQTGQWSVK
ncbi:DUF4352 domain-containing protein [Streptomyces sp. WM6378]|uniref:DUF4352 domain-containing protein n=1 Tax=Streptomyces sp. WM6378 TaxID=1415557 RepID=UPI0006AE3FE2|nr:DUF4352 domain-containing protein [Streptomyces sp. WM6378]KOU49110.1 hypothetical protein ADK54_10780 [Streptomyces sp. WM6378]